MKWVCLLMKGLGREKRWEMNTDVYWITALDGFCNAVPIKDMFSSIGNHSAILLRSPESRTGNTHHFFSYFVILYQDSMRFIVSCTMLVEKAMAPHSNTLAWKIPWTEKPGRSTGSEESDTTEQPHFHFSPSCIGEANGNPLQCSCLENPRDGGARWAAVCGVTQSRTRLKQLSSSSSSSIQYVKFNGFRILLVSSFKSN